MTRRRGLLDMVNPVSQLITRGQDSGDKSQGQQEATMSFSRHAFLIRTCHFSSCVSLPQIEHDARSCNHSPNTKVSFPCLCFPELHRMHFSVIQGPYPPYCTSGMAAAAKSLLTSAGCMSVAVGSKALPSNSLLNHIGGSIGREPP